jgi:hypothetical protein
VVTYQGAPVGFLVAGLIVVVTSRLWARLFGYVTEQIFPVVFGHDISSSQRRRFVFAYTVSTVFIGLFLMVIGSLRLTGAI